MSLERSVQEKLEKKYDLQLEAELKGWIEEVLETKLTADRSFQENLKDGSILCQWVTFANHHPKLRAYNSVVG